MKGFSKLILVSLLSVLGIYANAQATFSFVNIITDDTSYYYNENISIIAQLQYTGASSYTGELQAGYRVVNSQTSLNGQVPGFLQPIQVQSGSLTDVDTLKIPVSPAFFLEGGGHTVIVWPVVAPYPPGAVIDSSDFDIIVLGWMSQEEWNAEKQARVFPVPANDYLMLEKPNGKATISILDVQGKVVTFLYSTEKQIRIPLSHLPNGTYFLRYTDGVKPPEIHRFIKQ